tara:strand:+ start:551 stop:1042 length:492 start_codon:yes stop_codon:yes gene_type:complete
MNFKKLINEYNDFPTPGVNFKDISPLLASSEFKNIINLMGEMVQKPVYWVGVESRGFIFASALSIKFGGGLLLCRKAGKLPGKIITESYETEYSKDKLSIKYGTGDIIIVDDVLATGGTMKIVNKLCQSAGYNILDNLVLIDLKYVPRVEGYDCNTKSLIIYE